VKQAEGRVWWGGCSLYGKIKKNLAALALFAVRLKAKAVFAG